MRLGRGFLIILITLLPFAAGFAVSVVQSKYFGVKVASGVLHENHPSVPSTDMVTFSSAGDIYRLTSSTSTQLTKGQNLIDPVWTGTDFAAVNKNVNYSSILLYSDRGALVKKLLNGNSGYSGYDKWATDLAISPDGNQLAFVSDKDQYSIGIPDNALFVENLTNLSVKRVTMPEAFTGGLATPVFDPADQNLLICSSYHYDNQQNPYSTLNLVNLTTGHSIPITNQSQSAYQPDISPDGTRIVFLGRFDSSPVVHLFVGTFTAAGITNLVDLYQGQLAYPRFSFDGKSVYFLEGQKNKGFDLKLAQLSNNKLTNITAITSGETFDGTSSFEVTQNKSNN